MIVVYIKIYFSYKSGIADSRKTGANSHFQSVSSPQATHLEHKVIKIYKL